MDKNDLISSQDKLALADYSIEDFDRPSVAVDIAAFSLRTMKSTEYRLAPEPALCLLLIRRGIAPFKDCWALPGGFLKRDESIEDCAFRELEEETNLVPESMIWVDTFSTPGRDPRGWIISNAFASISCEEDAKITGSTDAAEACWFNVNFKDTGNGKYILELEYDDIKLSAKLKEGKTRTGKKCFTAEENNDISFDHASIIAQALETLKNEADNIETVFSFLPEKFTLSMLQKVQETLMGITLLTPNFRRKIAELVEETEEYTEGAGHRPAKLYKRRTNQES